MVIVDYFTDQLHMLYYKSSKIIIINVVDSINKSYDWIIVKKPTKGIYGAFR
jgi:hypothetical protein